MSRNARFLEWTYLPKLFGWTALSGGRGILRIAATTLLLCAATAVPSSAQTFTTLLNFDIADGATPYFMSFVQGLDGNLYGTTSLGGATDHACPVGCGTVLRMTPGGTITRLHSFHITDGESPYAGLAQDSRGNFYGTTYKGGANSAGVVFKMTPGGTLTTLYDFPVNAGSPIGALIQASDGNFYGTTNVGGEDDRGTVFKITPEGVLTTLCSFYPTSNGFLPYSPLVQASNGNFYGVTLHGGVDDVGTVFEVTPAGVLTTLHSFGGADGEYPTGGLILGRDGNLYGTTTFGGGSSSCGGGCGTLFKMTPAGALTTIYAFQGFSGGQSPAGGVVQGTDGNFYGTTQLGGNYVGCSSGCGTIFEITAAGILTTLHSFGTSSDDGSDPVAGLTQATNGIFYGTTSSDGDSGYGTVFSLSMGLPPFVETRPTSGKIGAQVIILGTDLTGTTSVSFNGIPAEFTGSTSVIHTTVPVGATTGIVTVTTPSGVLSSNLVFHVRP